MYEPQCDQSPLRAYETVRRFAARRGAVALRLASHAALPQVLRPDLLHLLRLNFVPEAGPDGAVEADVLFAPFCQDLGNGYYRFGTHARLHLLRELDPAHVDPSGPRSAEVARFLVQYLDQQGRRATGSYDRVFLDFLEIERWNALGFYDPQLAAQQLASALRQSLDGDAVAARLRFGGLASALSTPLAGHDRLLAYTAGLEALENQDHAQAREILESLGEQAIEVGTVRLPSPRQLAATRLPSTPPESAPEPQPAINAPPEEASTRAPKATASFPLPFRRLGLVYRHSDGEHVAKRLQAFLQRQLPEVEYLPEQRWTGSITPRPVDEETLLLVLIGSQWLLARDTAGKPRLSQPRDWLRRELEAAFAHRSRVVPILLDGVAVPTADQLPESLRPLTHLQALRLDAERWDADGERLVATLNAWRTPPPDRAAPATPPTVEQAAETAAPTPADPLDPGSGRVVLFVGHSVDRPHRPQPRFPLSLESTVRQEIARLLSAMHHDQDGLGVGLGLASGSDGGDILFHEVCAELGIRTALFLPIDPSAFVGTLLGAGWNWMERFEALTRKPSVHVVVQENSPFVTESIPLESPVTESATSVDPWGANARVMMERALASGAERAFVLALWNGEPGGPGGPADIIRQAEAAGVEVFVIDPRELLKPDSAPSSEARSSPTVYLSYSPKDRAEAEHVVDILQKAGIRVWDPARQLKSNDLVQKQVERAIDQLADYFLVLLSANHTETASDGLFSSLEIRIALDRQERSPQKDSLFIVPIELRSGENELFPNLANLKKFSWFQGLGAGVLVQAILDDWSRRHTQPSHRLETTVESTSASASEFHPDLSPPDPPEASPPAMA